MLANLHPEGILGFVLPRRIDGQGYEDVRSRLAERFAKIDVVALPNKAFETSDSETALVLASKPRKHNASTVVRYSKVTESEWGQFHTFHVLARLGSGNESA